jgi:hypothetical protein
MELIILLSLGMLPMIMIVGIVSAAGTIEE